MDCCWIHISIQSIHHPAVIRQSSTRLCSTIQLVKMRIQKPSENKKKVASNDNSSGHKNSQISTEAEPDPGHGFFGSQLARGDFGHPSPTGISSLGEYIHPAYTWCQREKKSRPAVPKNTCSSMASFQCPMMRLGAARDPRWSF